MPHGKSTHEQTNGNASDGTPLTDDDRELLALAAEVGQCAESARNLVLRAATQRHVARSWPSIADAKRFEEVDRMRRMLLAWRALRPEDGAPYPDARMLLTEGVLFYGGIRRVPIPGVTHEQTKHELRANAECLASLVASHYPTIAARLTEPDRIERICAAIASTATSAKRRPWKVIAATWDGIEASECDSEAWRQAYVKHQQRRREEAKRAEF